MDRADHIKMIFTHDELKIHPLFRDTEVEQCFVKQVKAAVFRCPGCSGEKAFCSFPAVFIRVICFCHVQVPLFDEI